jgi:peptidoglycan/LPS O-acetylase OafA/YrhL/Tfp pilus assembly protein PilF
MQPVPTVPVSSAEALRPAGGYQPALDGLRGVAILLVIAYHDHLLRGGFIGVQVFFVLSGYLITSLLQREHEAAGSIRLGRFYGRRFLRLAPALCLFVAAAWAVTHWLKPGLAHWLQASWALAAIFYVSNLLIAYGREYPLGVVSICWSLALEEQFYLLWPATLALLHRARVLWRRLAIFLAGLIACCLLLRYILLARHRGDPNLWLRVYFGPDTSAEALLWGCLLAVLVSRVGVRPFARIATGGALAAFAVLAAVAIRIDIAHMVAQPALSSLTAIGSCALILAALTDGFIRRLLELRALVWIGQLSYSLYLWHAFSIDLLIHEPRWRRYAFMLGIAAASYYLVERPVQGLARRWGALARPHPWSRGAAWEWATGPVAGAAGLAIALLIGCVRLTGGGVPGLALPPSVQARERFADGEYERSADQYRSAAALDAANGGLRSDLGQALLMAGKPLEAAAAFRQAVKLDMNQTDAHSALGSLALNGGRSAEAVHHLTIAAAQRPGHLVIRNELGVALALEGRYDEAIAQFEAALRLGAGRDVQENLVRARADRGKSRPVR